MFGIMYNNPFVFETAATVSFSASISFGFPGENNTPGDPEVKPY